MAKRINKDILPMGWENVDSAEVYREPKSGDKPLKNVPGRRAGVWMGKMPLTHTNPCELWTFEDGYVPRNLVESEHPHGIWGFKPGTSESDIRKNSFPPEDFWFFPPKSRIPGEGFQPLGVWSFPVKKRDISGLAPNASGFLHIGEYTKHEDLDVGGSWRMLYKRDDEYRGPGMKSDRKKEPPPPPQPIKIQVKKPDGEKIPLEVWPDETIDDIKRKIEDKSDIPKDEQRLRHRGHELDDPLPTVEETGIEDGDILELMPMEIFVKNPKRNKTYTVTVEPTFTISNVKSKLDRQEDIPKENQRLSFQGKILKDKPTLRDSGIKHHDTLVLEPMEIKVRQPNGKLIPLEVNPSDSIESIKDRVEKPSGIPKDAQRLLKDGSLLDNEPTLENVGIKHGDVLDLEPMKIHVKTPQGKKITLNVSPNDTIDDIKGMVKAKEKIPKDRQRLTHKGRELKSDKPTLDDCGIKHNDVLNLEPMEIKVRKPDGGLIPLQVDPDDTVEDIKKRCAKPSGIPKDAQRILKDGKLLDDKPTLDDAGIKHGDVLDLEPMQIHVKTPQGKKITLDVSPDDTIDDIKDKVNDKEGIPKKKQRLTHRGKELDDRPTLDDCGIKHNDVLNLEPMEIKVRKPDGGLIPLQVDPDDTIEDIKKRCAKPSGIPKNAQRLHKDGDLLDDEPTLDEAGIEHGDILDLGPMQIHVKTPQGKNITLDVTPDDTIGDIKDKVENKEGIPKDRQRLSYKGKELPSNRPSLDDCGIKHNDVLNLEPMQIKVKSPEGKVVTMDVDPDDTVEDVKNRVKDALGIPVDDQRLLHKGKELDNEPTLDDCGIKHGDVLDLDPMTIFVEKPDGKKFPLAVSPSDTIDDVKQKVKDKEGIPKDRQRLTFKGKELKDRPTLKDSGIKHKDTLKLEPMQIHVKKKGGKKITLDVDPDDTVEDVKKQVEDQLGVPVPNQRLLFNGDELDNEPTLDECGIKHDDTLNLEPMQITVKTPEGKDIVLDVAPTDTIDDIKQKVKDKEGIPKDDQRLLHKGKELDDDKPTLDDCGIKHGDVLNLDPMRIHVRTPKGKKYTLTVTPSDTIKDIKKKVKTASGIPTKDQRLLKDGRDLDRDEPTLKDLGIVNDDVLDLGPMEIIIKDWKNKTFPLIVDPDDTIDSVKDQIKGKRDIEKHNQYLTFNDKLLDDPNTLRDYGVKHKDVINLDRMKIYVRDENGKKFPLIVDKNDSVLDTKKKIMDKEGIPIEDQLLVFKMDPMLDNQTLDDCGVKYKDTIDLKAAPRTHIQEEAEPEPNDTTHVIGLTPWSNPFEVANVEKAKIKRDGKKAKSAELLAARYHTTFENEMEEHRKRAIKEAERKTAEKRAAKK